MSTTTRFFTILVSNITRLYCTFENRFGYQKRTLIVQVCAQFFVSFREKEFDYVHSVRVKTILEWLWSAKTFETPALVSHLACFAWRKTQEFQNPVKSYGSTGWCESRETVLSADFWHKIYLNLWFIHFCTNFLNF